MWTKTRLRFAQLRNACKPAVRVARKYARELLIALVLAIVAAVLYEPCKDFLAKRALQRASKAVAKLFIQDANGKPIGTASGVFISPDGLLVTNAHVATAAKGGQILAQLSTQALYEVKKTVGVNPAYDIAVLQFQASEVPFVPINMAIIAQAGEHVWAIGSPNGLEGSISEGVISRPQTQIKGVDFIQFTAPISRGSSGGGLFNLLGSVRRRNAESVEFRGQVQGDLQPRCRLCSNVRKTEHYSQPANFSNFQS
jgi:S1-C subfamily serine protease